MSRLTFLVIIALSIASAAAEDQEKAEKQVRKITAMATDKTGRAMVSMSLSDFLKISRPLMIEQRRTLGLDYGAFFVAHMLLSGGLTMPGLIAELRAGKTVWQIGNEKHANWNKVAGDAKKENTKIEDYIYRHFLNKKNSETDLERDFEDKYDPARDAVRTDFMVTPKEMVDAQTRFIFWRDQAGKSRGLGRPMNRGERVAADMDHADARHDTEGGIAAPAAGGLPTH